MSNERERKNKMSVEPTHEPRCSICGESPPHTLGDCPAAQSGEITRMHLLTCRKLLREAREIIQSQRADHYAHALVPVAGAAALLDENSNELSVVGHG